MDKEKIKEIIGNNLPSNIDFNFFDDILQVVLKSESVSGNMQEDSSAFEGWILCIKSVLENNDYSVKKVIKNSRMASILVAPQKRNNFAIV